MMNSFLKSTTNPNTSSKKQKQSKRLIPELKFEQAEVVAKVGMTGNAILQWVGYKINHSSVEGVTIDDEKAFIATYSQISKTLGCSKKQAEHTIRKLEKEGILVSRHVDSFSRWMGKAYRICIKKLYEILGISRSDKDISAPPPSPKIGRSPPEIGSINTKALSKTKKLKIKKDSLSDQRSNPPSAAIGASDSSLFPVESDLEYAEIADLDEIMEDEETFLPYMMEKDESSCETMSNTNASDLISYTNHISFSVFHRLRKSFSSTTLRTWFKDTVLPLPSCGFASIKVCNAWKADKIDEIFGFELSKIYGQGNYELIY